VTRPVELPLLDVTVGQLGEVPPVLEGLVPLVLGREFEVLDLDDDEGVRGARLEAGEQGHVHASIPGMIVGGAAQLNPPPPSSRIIFI
jgi:hypothetical protein